MAIKNRSVQLKLKKQRKAAKKLEQEKREKEE